MASRSQEMNKSDERDKRLQKTAKTQNNDYKKTYFFC
jgi:hypothetical protein